MKHSSCPHDWHAYLEGELARSQMDALDAHLAGCAACRAELAGLRELIGLLARPDEVYAELDLSSSLFAARPRPVRGLRLSRVAAVVGLLVLAGLGLGAWWLLRAPEDSSGIRVKAVRDEVPESDRWVAVLPHRLPEAGNPQRLGEQMRRSDSLLLAYTNLGPRPFENLMIFAVDARGRVHWYFPAYLEPGEDPSSIPIKKSSTGVELSEAIRHDLSPGTMRLVALFSRRPMRVSEIERIVGELWEAGSWWESTRLPIADTGQHIVTTEVIP